MFLKEKKKKKIKNKKRNKKAKKDQIKVVAMVEIGKFVTKEEATDWSPSKKGDQKKMTRDEILFELEDTIEALTKEQAKTCLYSESTAQRETEEEFEKIYEIIDMYILMRGPVVPHPTLPVRCNLVTGEVVADLHYDAVVKTYDVDGLYKCVHIRHKGKTVARMAHRLVVECVIGRELSYDYDVHHCDRPEYERDSAFNLRIKLRKYNRGYRHDTTNRRPRAHGPFAVYKDGEMIGTTATQYTAAEMIGCSRQGIKKHVQGLRPSIHGHVLVPIERGDDDEEK